MNIRLEKKHKVILAISFLLASAIFAGSYFFYISPLKSSLALKETQLKSEQQLAEMLLARMSSVEDGAFASTAEMQKILPADEMVEQIVLDLEKAEVVSGSLITSMEFADDDGMASSAEETPAAEGTTGSEAESAKPDIPDGMAKTLVTVSVESSDYFGLERFIETIENLPRLLMVESIEFTGPEEIDTISISEENAPIMMTLVLNSFYLTGMDDLKEFNPKIETPEPGNKRNPFPSGAPELETDGTSEDQ